jgi:hypothetical protein
MRSLIFVLLSLFACSLNGAFAQIQIDSIAKISDSITAQSFDVVEENPTQQAEKKQANNSLTNFVFNKDSLDVYRYSFFPDSVNYINLLFLDTANHNAGQYNPVKQFDLSYLDLGPIGSAQYNQVFSPSSGLGFRLGIDSYDAFLWKEKDLSLYDNRSPYSRIFYLTGSKKENILKLSHAQSFMDQQITMQFDFQLYNHLGFYENQHSDTKSFKGGMGYRTKNKRYSIGFQYYHNKLIYEENGGIFDLDDFELNRETNRQVITTNLNNANNLIRISGITIKQDFYLSKPEPDLSQISDTNIIEYDAYSVIHFSKPWFEPVSHFGKLSYRFNYQRENYKYTDSDQNAPLYDSIAVYNPADGSFTYNSLPYYPTPDSSSMFDSISVRNYTHELIYSNSDYKDDAFDPKFMNYFFGIRNEFNYWHQACFNTREWNQNVVLGGVFISLTKFLSLAGDASYYFGEYSSNDFQINGKIYLKLKGNELNGGIRIEHRTPNYIYQEFTTSRLRWSNSFGKTDQQQIFVNFERKNLWASFKVLNIKNHLYFNEVYQPEQISENIQHIVLEARKDFRFGHWGVDINLIYQAVSNSVVVRVPEISAKARFFYHNFFFKDVLEFELGIEGFYFTEYYANRYNPLIRSWYIQNVQSIGNYPFLDAYLNAKIGKARLFVRYDNFNANFMDNKYYASPFYPALDPMFRFGVNWILFN